MSTEKPDPQEDNNTNPEILTLKNELMRQKEITQTWMGKATDYEKKIGNKNLDALIEAAKERDILASQIASGSGDPKKIDEEIEKRAKAIREEFAPQLSKKDEEIKGLTSKIKEMLVVNKVFEKVSSEIYPKAVEEFKNYIRGSCDINDEEQIIIRDAKGNVRYSASNAALPMSVDEFIEELADQKDHWFVNKTPAGGRMAGDKSVNGGGTWTLESLNKLSPEKQKEILSSMKLEERMDLAKQIRF